jgi:uncharacterized iron-regulated membrane protein
MLRRLLVAIHRWFGLGRPRSCSSPGLTGAIISWDHEIDAWLNPELFVARTQGPALPALELARRVEPPTRACA